MAPQSPNEALQPEAPPPPPPRRPVRRRPTLSALSGFVSFLAIASVGALATLAYGSSRLQEPGPLPAARTVYILPHTDLPDIIEKLGADGVIDSPFTMNVVLAVERKRKKVKAGEYLFKEHASLRDVIDTLVSGKQYLHAVTIPEGLTTQQIVQRIRDSDLLTGDVRDLPKEGALLPETYKVSRGTTRSDLVAKMQEDDRRMVEQVWARRAPELPLRSPYDMLTLASIVEKETGKAEERPRVAAVFVNRLRKHMRLQSDPTIVYGLVGGQGTLGHSITRSELDKRTSFNTYQIDGLPPGPIDNPGRAALEAVANPMKTDELYFVADGTGGHVFADTLDEHNRNVQHWRQVERDGKAKSDVDKLSPTAGQPGAATPTPAPPHGSQRSDNDPIFGALPTRIAASNIGIAAAFADPDQSHDIEKVAAAEARGPVGRSGARGYATMPDPASYSRSLDTLGFAMEVAAPAGPSLLDGPTTPDVATAAGPAVAAVNGSAASAAPQGPLGPRGATPGPGKAAVASLDGGASDHPDLFSDPAGDATPAAPMKMPPAHPKIYDASENTAIDPLRDKSFDLNTAKTIPAEFTR